MTTAFETFASSNASGTPAPAAAPAQDTAPAPTGGTAFSSFLKSSGIQSQSPAPQTQVQTPTQTDQNDTFAGTKADLAQIEANPLSLGNTEKIPSDFLNSFSDAWNGLKENLKGDGTMQDFQKEGGAGSMGESLKAISGLAGVAFSPISALFKTAEDLPVIGTVAKGIDTAFTAAGEGGSAAGQKIVDQLPIKDPAEKQTLKEGVGDIFALAAQIALGKAGEIAKTNIVGEPFKVANGVRTFSDLKPETKTIIQNALDEKYGKTDAQTIIDHANELATQHPEVQKEVQAKVDAAADKVANPTTEKTPEQISVENSAQKVAQVTHEKISDTAYKNTVENGGVTISAEGDQPSKGVAYSPYKDTERVIPKDKFTAETTAQYMADHADKLKEPGNHLGIWEDNGNIYMDISKVGDNTPETYEEAMKAKQLAVFDLSSFETVPLGKIEDGVYTRDYEKASDHPNFNKGENTRTSPQGVESKPPEVQESKPGNKITGKASDVNRRLVEKGFDNIPEDEQAKFASSEGQRKTQIENVAKFMDSNIEEAKQVALGDKEAPEGVPPQILHNAMVEYADKNGNYALLRDLAGSKHATDLSTHASELESAKYGGSRTETAGKETVRAIKEQTKAREEFAEKEAKKEGTTVKRKESVLKEKGARIIKDKIVEKKSFPKLEEFIKNITC